MNIKSSSLVLLCILAACGSGGAKSSHNDPGDPGNPDINDPNPGMPNPSEPSIDENITDGEWTIWAVVTESECPLTVKPGTVLSYSLEISGNGCDLAETDAACGYSDDSVYLELDSLPFQGGNCDIEGTLSFELSETPAGSGLRGTLEGLGQVDSCESDAGDWEEEGGCYFNGVILNHLPEEEPIDPSKDFDGDGVKDDRDNCRFASNADQEDRDGSGLGDLCDPDGDGDLIPDSVDNCSGFNPDQKDSDGEGTGDACETDTDGDGVYDKYDNCPENNNPDQKDQSGNGVGDVCDRDSDSDGIFNWEDNCRNIKNPSQSDTDRDGIGDDCDGDLDNDGRLNNFDNCRNLHNPDQADRDGDSKGDACDDEPAKAKCPIIRTVEPEGNIRPSKGQKEFPNIKGKAKSRDPQKLIEQLVNCGIS